MVKNSRPKSRDLIMDAMEGILNQHGFEAATVDVVIERSGVARGTFYYNFPSKNAVIHALARRAAQPMVTRARERLSNDASLSEILSDIALGIADWNQQHPKLGRAVLSSIYDERGVPVPTDPNNPESFRSFLSDVFLMSQQKGEIREDIPAMNLSLMFIGMLYQGLFMWFVRPDAANLPLWAQQSASLFLEGVKL
ncbi:TetR/AcrR family transcriptional regulator [Kiloniella sp. EL199]|uniref:TetR/AcrR family transcriptional regulator n=1 Tax=Kiloniella sp. EL199 TaxID=2107581 RepID=UPI000EA27E37|nr:TetR/AcrR family transcriptional regulator [Kiloniella sp. EL199]